jgi:phosphatidylserine/phosphatidylglycerophosphate/cardiolipin synthase-like enzyme
MLNTCDFANGKWRYREIYIHSKLLLIDDTFLTLGSANLNQRSMAVDSEINLAAIAPDKASDLRRRIWRQLGDTDDLSGGNGSRPEIATAFGNWRDRLEKNGQDKKDGKAISGLLLPLEDKRSSLVRLG